MRTNHHTVDLLLIFKQHFPPEYHTEQYFPCTPHLPPPRSVSYLPTSQHKRQPQAGHGALALGGPAKATTKAETDPVKLPDVKDCVIMHVSQSFRAADQHYYFLQPDYEHRWSLNTALSLATLTVPLAYFSKTPKSHKPIKLLR
ncbi:hypothetical protein E2C01_037590 [Portunus trituberculatus]|uniref:Uncharacterized protein n=1 Tax=Portunus trituberculatus TaxID=210409 RepID=A0A5B7FBT8_PORTR|nr:hypothetical protein [Portunus trituberculatus]